MEDFMRTQGEDFVLDLAYPGPMRTVVELSCFRYEFMMTVDTDLFTVLFLRCSCGDSLIHGPKCVACGRDSGADKWAWTLDKSKWADWLTDIVVEELGLNYFEAALVALEVQAQARAAAEALRPGDADTATAQALAASWAAFAEELYFPQTVDSAPVS